MESSDVGKPGARFKGKLGMAVRKSLKDLMAEHGVDQAKLLQTIPPESRWMLTTRFVATEWYSLNAADRMLAVAAHEFEMDQNQLALRLGGDVAYESAGRVGWTLLTLFASPSRVARHLDAMWSQLYDSGTVTGTYNEDTGILRVTRREWEGHHANTCLTLLGSLERMSKEMRGYRLCRSERTCCVDEHDGDACTFEMHFERLR